MYIEVMGLEGHYYAVNPAQVFYIIKVELNYRLMFPGMIFIEISAVEYARVKSKFVAPKELTH